MVARDRHLGLFLGNIMKASVIDFVKTNVSPEKYYSTIFPDLRWPSKGIESRRECVFHKDKDPSLHFNPDTGAWFCHGCDAGGNSIISFHAKLNELSRTEAAKQIYHLFIRPIIPDEQISKWNTTLMDTPSALNYLTSQRLISIDTIDQYDIGYNGTRFMIPIRDEFGLCVNVKMYDPIYKKHGVPKMLNYRLETEKRSYGSPPMIYPISVLSQDHDNSWIVICEGEWDTLFLLSMGIPAVTSTTGCKSWARQYNEWFRGKRICIAYDNDTDGLRYDKKVVVHNLRKFVKAITRLKIPKKSGVDKKPTKDVNEWGINDTKMRALSAWLRVIGRASKILENPDEYIESSSTHKVSLDQASEAQWFNRSIMVDAIVTGKDIAPYLLPKTYRASCNKSCDTCCMAEYAKPYKEIKLDPSDPTILTLLDKTDKQIRGSLLAIAGIESKPSCQGKIEVLETFNVEQMMLIPTLDSGSGSQYVMRQAYYSGHGLNSNRAYQFKGTTVPHPEDQHTTHLFTIAKPVQDEIGTFKLSAAMKGELRIFQPGRRNLMSHLKSIARWQSINVTNIRERLDVHIGVDLVYHSVASFEFNGEYQRRGMLDALIIGDTRCGKGYIAEGLKRFYGMGEVASGENCTFAGLVGGVQQTNKRFFITWGLIPLNNNRLVVIDEASSLTEVEISRMSRVRSEGVAEIVKIVRESTSANVRLIWLSNPRDGERMENYADVGGVHAIKKLIGANEDISRFDFAITVATNEVDSNIINVVNNCDDKSSKFTREVCRNLVLWAWSRRPEQIKFTAEADREVIEAAIAFGRMYSPNIPLVQSENIRIKIAKIAAAIAARTFSTDRSGEMLFIETRHVECACQFLHMVYSKPSMAYDVYSKRAILTSTINQSEPIESLFKGLELQRTATIIGLLELHRVSVDTLTDYVGDITLTRDLIGNLVRLRCLMRIESGNWYLKNPAFSQWLKTQRDISNGKVITARR